MGEHTEISWTDHTFNALWGCTKISPACDGCYAEAWAKRFGVGWGPKAIRKTFGEKHWLEPAKWARKAGREGVRRRVFTSSMADVFEDHPTVAAERLKLWDVIDSTWHDLDWLILTKRINRVRECLAADGRPPDYFSQRRCWVGTTVENQEWARRRLDHLVEISAAVRFVSCEPLFGDLDLAPWLDRLHWVISGGMSGDDAKPSHPDWFRSLRDQCIAASVAFHHKQNGEWVSASEVAGPGRHHYFPDGATVRRVGKKAAGRSLDGRTWDQFPAVAEVTNAR